MKYRVMVEAENLKVAGAGEPLGFFVSKDVEAENEEEAKKLALELVEQETKLKYPLEDSDSAPSYSVKEVNAI